MDRVRIKKQNNNIGLLLRKRLTILEPYETLWLSSTLFKLLAPAPYPKRHSWPCHGLLAIIGVSAMPYMHYLRCCERQSLRRIFRSFSWNQLVRHIVKISLCDKASRNVAVGQSVQRHVGPIYYCSRGYELIEVGCARILYFSFPILYLIVCHFHLHVSFV